MSAVLGTRCAPTRSGTGPGTRRRKPPPPRMALELSRAARPHFGRRSGAPLGRHAALRRLGRRSPAPRPGATRARARAWVAGRASVGRLGPARPRLADDFAPSPSALRSRAFSGRRGLPPPSSGCRSAAASSRPTQPSSFSLARAAAPGARDRPDAAAFANQALCSLLHAFRLSASPLPPLSPTLCRPAPLSPFASPTDWAVVVLA